MNSQEILANIASTIQKAGAPLREVEVEAFGDTHKYWFRRIPFIEADRLRVHGIGNDGKFDSALHAGANARLVAATLVDSGGNVVVDAATVESWPTALVDAMALAANVVNGTAATTKAEVAKNSETPRDDA